MSDVRSVTVRLHADVDGYISRMRTAGKETDRAFSRSAENIRAVNLEMAVTDHQMQQIDKSGRSMNTTLARSNTRLRNVADQSGKLNGNLAGLGLVTGRLNGAGRESLPTLNRNAGYSVKQLDTMSGRVGLLGEALIAIGPAAVPIGAAAIPALAGLASEAGAAAGALGLTLLAFNGIGDGLKALDAYQLEPTQANLEKMRIELDKLGPSGAHFVRYISSLEPQLQGLQEATRGGLFPGVEKGIDSLLGMLPQVTTIVVALATEMGRLSAEAGKELAGGGFSDFFDYLQTDAAPTLEMLGHSIGNVVEGLASLVVAIAPVSRDFNSGMESMTQSFADWAAGVGQTKGFRDFLTYLETTGPQVLQLLGALATSLVQIATAAAPVGTVLIPILTSLAEALGDIAASPIGTPLLTAAAGFVALSRAVKLFGPGIGNLNEAFLDLRTSPNVAATAVERFGGAARAAAGAAGMGLFVASLSETDHALSAFESTAGGALAGFSVGGPWGAAVGGAIGLVVSLGRAHDDTASRVQALTGAFDQQTGAITANTRATAAHELQQKGLLDAADQLGISTDTVTAAVLGNARAQQVLNAATTGYDVDHTITSVQNLRKSFSDAEIQTILNNRAATSLRDNLPGLTKEFGLAGGQAKQLAAASGGAAGAQDKYSASTRDAAAASGFTAAKVDRLTASMVANTSAALDAFDAETQWRQALKDAAAQAGKNDAGIRDSTDAALANRGAISELVAAWNGQSDAVKNNIGRYESARHSLITTAEAMGVTKQRAVALAKAMLQVPKKLVTEMAFEADDAFFVIKQLRAELASIPRSIRTDYYVTQMNAINKGPVTGPQAKATGGPIIGRGTKTSDSVPVMASNGEFMMSAAAVDHYGINTMFQMNARRLAGGGPVAGIGPIGTATGHQSVADQLAILQIVQQLHDLRASLAKDGKNKLEGINRRVAELQLLSAQKELRLAQTREAREAAQAARDKAKDEREKLQQKAGSIRDAAGSLSFDSVAPVEDTAASQVAATLKDFRAQVIAAGGEWTKSLSKWAQDMIGMARELDHARTALEAEQAKRDALVDTLNDQQAQLDQLNSTMEAYSQSVSANFLHDPFNSTATLPGGGPATDALKVAQDQLAALRASSTGDSIMTAAQASQLVAQIAALQAKATVEASTTQPVDPLDALRTTLTTDTKNAQDFAATLQELADKGLATSGADGGLYQQLASSGDSATATELAQLTPAQIAEYEKLFKDRTDVAATVAAQATQAVYGTQEAQLEQLVSQTTAAITAADTTIAVLNIGIAALGGEVRAGAQDGSRLLQPQLTAINGSIKDIARQLGENKKKASL